MKNSPSLKEYANQLNDTDIHCIYVGFHEGDTGGTTDYVSKNKDIEKWLSTAESTDEFFKMMDQIQAAIDAEYRSRLSSGRLKISDFETENG